jgi:malate dehydrogenase
MQKVTIVGAGRVGEAAAQFLAAQELCREIVLLDVRDDSASGVALDIMQTSPFLGFDTRLAGTSDPALLAGSELVVVTAGQPRKPGMSRSDVLDANLRIIDGITDNVLRYAPDAMLLMVTNPVDVLTYRVYRRTGWERARVFGQAGVLDASRMAAFVAAETGFSVRDVTTLVLGGHGDTMVPLPRFCTVNGIPLSYFMDSETMQEIIDRTRSGGAEVLALRKISSAYDAPGASIAAMVDAVSHNRRRILPSVAILDGEYGETDIAMGVPSVLDSSGLSGIVELELDPQEKQLFAQSVAAIRRDLARLAV